MPLMAHSLLISIATYNEAGNIEQLLLDIRRCVPDAHILVVDDNSPDHTGEIVDRMGRIDSHIKIVHRPGKQGIGTAMLRGFEFGMVNGYQQVLTMDADFSHNPADILNILAGMKNYDVMIGSRYVKGGSIKNWPWTRYLISYAVNVLVRNLFKLPIRDTSGGFRCYKIGILRMAGLELMQSTGYSFLEELIHRCHSAGARIGETPITFENRKAGASKVSGQEAWRSLSLLIKLGIAFRWRGLTPSKKKIYNPTLSDSKLNKRQSA